VNSTLCFATVASYYCISLDCLLIIVGLRLYRSCFLLAAEFAAESVPFIMSFALSTRREGDASGVKAFAKGPPVAFKVPAWVKSKW